MTVAQKTNIGLWITCAMLVLTGGAWSGRQESRIGDIKVVQEIHSEAIKQLLETSINESRALRDEINSLKVQQGRVEEKIEALRQQIAK